MVAQQIKRRGIKDRRLLEVMGRVPREVFVLPQDRGLAYGDSPLPIGFGQTISQPYIVAYMIEQLELKATDTVLEIGTGSGYSAAIMAELCAKVYTLEVVKELYDRTHKLLARLHYKNIECRLSDGYHGLLEVAPFDKIILTAAPPDVPRALLAQLGVGGRLIAPIGPIRMFQRLMMYDKVSRDVYKEKELLGVAFVEMVNQS